MVCLRENPAPGSAPGAYPVLASANLVRSAAQDARAGWVNIVPCARRVSLSEISPFQTRIAEWRVVAHAECHETYEDKALCEGKPKNAGANFVSKPSMSATQTS
jgi:hypothetical protein